MYCEFSKIIKRAENLNKTNIKIYRSWNTYILQIGECNIDKYAFPSEENFMEIKKERFLNTLDDSISARYAKIGSNIYVISVRLSQKGKK